MAIDLTGQTRGRWLVLQNLGVRTRSSGRMYLCRCRCGTEKEVRASYLLDGRSKSCGCYSADLTSTHGATRGGKQTPEFQSWATMTRRCYTRSSANFSYYGGRGIRVCERWRGKTGFASFLSDMGQRPAGASLDRIDPNADYSPSNCRWASAKEQSRTRRNSRERVREILDAAIAAFAAGPKVISSAEAIGQLESIRRAVCD